ncbi:organic solute transporter Ostalpha-domain-containing protein [Phascolomyces articulosus]|uniref:Organic solute transporter Ostalpha-domain-containing protein n=1 Tax=Phascolomyces articulosus TaxID=60185 RepID=A0AAD5PF38_9FUNG|nr:organic solute transporter Ostalpha-domain-containing protein [Phascolomyces articulosus]
MSMRMLFAPANQDGYGESGGAGAVFSPFAVHLALVFTIVASCISSFSVWLHWKNYRKPNQQRQVIRILWMVPVYGISTYISLISLNAAFFVDTVRDIYEAFVIYAFFNLLLNKLGGERALIIMLHSRPPSDNFFPGTLWSREIYVGDPYTFLFVKRGILQFVYVKPILAILTMILKVTGNYQEGEISWSSSYVYLTFFYNLSVSLTLWCLMVFFYATKKDLTGFRPFPKFLCVKAIIFFSFWQSVIVALLVSAGVIPEGEGTEHMSVAIQDFLICLEMIPAAIAHSFSFSYEDYYDHNVHSARMPIMHAIRDSLGLKDVYMDTLDTLRGTQFNYRSFEPSEGVPHIGSSRTSRIMAGLRYSSSTAKKHWLEPAPVSRYLNTGGRGMNGEIVEDEDPLEFDDPNPWDEVEALYEQSRNMVFGDYNYPVIDFRAPLWRQVRRMASPTGSTRSRGYGSTATRNEEQQQNNNGSIQSSKVPIPPQQPILPSSQKRQKRKSKLRTSYVPTPREGCVDVIIEQGKGNYVVVPDIDDHDNVDDASIPPPSSGSSSSSSVGPSQQPKQPQPQQRLLQQSKQTLPFDRTPPPIRQSRSTPQPTVEPSTSPTTTPSQHLSSSSQQQQPSSPSHLQQDTSSIPSTSSFSSPQPHPSFSSPSSNNIYPESSILQQHTNNQHDNRSFWPTENPSSRPNIHDLFNDRHEDEDTDALFNTGNVWK